MATANDGDTAKTVLLSALQELNRKLAKLVENGRKNFEAMKSDRLDEFLNVDCEVGFPSLFPGFLYVDCLKKVGVKTWSGLVEMWKGCYHDEEVRVRVEELSSLEKRLQELYDEIDEELQKAEDQLAFRSITKVGELLPEELSLLECKSGEAIHLKTFWKQSKFTLFVPLKFYF